jgi:nicotinamidase-related amidase
MGLAQAEGIAVNALLIIDTQVNMFDPAHPVAGSGPLLQRIGDLVARARAARTPIVFVRNCGGPEDPDLKGTPGWELHPSLKPAAGDVVLDKTTDDTFASTALEDELVARKVDGVVIAGLQSDYCIRETTLGALARGLDVTLVEDAHSTYDGGGRSAAEISAGVNAELGDRAHLVRSGDVGFD